MAIQASLRSFSIDHATVKVNKTEVTTTTAPKVKNAYLARLNVPIRLEFTFAIKLVQNSRWKKEAPILLDSSANAKSPPRTAYGSHISQLDVSEAAAKIT